MERKKEDGGGGGGGSGGSGGGSGLVGEGGKSFALKHVFALTN